MPSAKSRFVVFGGTFDPPHKGHLAVADAVVQHYDVEKVLFVVAGQPWQKMERQKRQRRKTLTRSGTDIKDLASDGKRPAGYQISAAEDRVAMVEAAIAGHPKFEASTVEIERGGPSYTADTLEDLAKKHPDTELLLLIGSDLVAELNTWKRPETIRKLSNLVIVERPGYEKSQLPPEWSDNHSYIPGELVDVSSRQLKGLTGERQVASDLLPTAVSKIITERGLYRGGPGTEGED